MPIAIPPRLAEQPSRGRANLKRLRRSSDAVIAGSSPPELCDVGRTAWIGAVRLPPIERRPLTLRLDAHVVAWFHAHGPRAETRMQLTLRAYMKRIARARMID